MRLTLGDVPKPGEKLDAVTAPPDALPAGNAARAGQLTLGEGLQSISEVDAPPVDAIPVTDSVALERLALGGVGEVPAKTSEDAPTIPAPSRPSLGLSEAPAVAPPLAPSPSPKMAEPSRASHSVEKQGATEGRPTTSAAQGEESSSIMGRSLPPIPPLPSNATPTSAPTPAVKSVSLKGLPPLPDPKAPTTASKPSRRQQDSAAQASTASAPSPTSPSPATAPLSIGPTKALSQSVGGVDKERSKTRDIKPVKAAAESMRADQSAKGGGGKAPVRLGDRLVERGLISKDQLAVALHEKKNSPKMMGELLVDLGFITEQALSAVLAEDSGFERFDPQGSMVDPELLKLIPVEIASRYRVFPSTVEDKTARVAMADIYDVLALDQVKRYLPSDWEIQPLVCSDTEIQQAIDQYYGHELSIDGILRELDSLREGELDAAALDDTHGGYTHPVVRLVNAILLDAVKSKASDIHFEPEGNFLRVRYRIDGMMMQVRTIHKQHWGAFSHRLKIMSGMNIADRLNPQDGRFSLSMANKRIDFRVSSLPTVHGENLVLRILDKSSAQVRITELGYSTHNFEMLTRMVKRPEGIIIVTGPTGSGKTTTLYAIMNYINSLDLNIMTLEDPVEFELSLIRQSQIREGSQMTFAEGIRTLMRQDPDVILVGEVRDSDTASMAVRAAMTRPPSLYDTAHQRRHRRYSTPSGSWLAAQPHGGKHHWHYRATSGSQAVRGLQDLQDGDGGRMPDPGH